MSHSLKIAIVADSLALPRPAEAGLVRYEETYPVLLRRMLSSVVSDREILIAECGQRFRTMSSVLQDWTEIVDYRQPHFAVVHVGIVDCAPRIFSASERTKLERLRPALLRRIVLSAIRRLRPLLISVRKQRVYTSLPDFEAACRAVLKRADQSGVRNVIMVNILQPTAELESRSPGYIANYETYNALLRKVCGDHGTSLLDYDRLVQQAGGTATMTVDGMHPNPAGHHLLAQAICETITEKLQKYSVAC